MFKNQYDLLRRSGHRGFCCGPGDAAGFSNAPRLTIAKNDTGAWDRSGDTKLNFQSPAAVWGFPGRNPGKAKRKEFTSKGWRCQGRNTKGERTE